VGIVFVDDREGSAELEELLPDSLLVHLDYADAMFEGNGPDGPVSIGIERKKIEDLIGSMETGRLSGHQIPGLLNDYYRSYLIVEGRWKANLTSGQLMVMKSKPGSKPFWMPIQHGTRTYQASGIWNYLTTIEVMTGIMIRLTSDLRDTAHVIMQLADWWGRPWKSHHSHLSLHKPPPPTADLRPPTLLRKIASELPGIGWQKSLHVESHFGSVNAMIAASVKEWTEVQGIGKTLANAIWSLLHTA
jgi:ERCC4-type nuclease